MPGKVQETPDDEFMTWTDTGRIVFLGAQKYFNKDNPIGNYG